MAGSVTENVTKLSFASERMQAAERAHNFVVDSSLQMTPTTSELGVEMSITVTMSAVQSHTPDVMQMRCRTVSLHRR